MFCESHPDMRVAHSCFENVPPFRFWSLSNQFPSFQVRLMSYLVLTEAYHGSKIQLVPFASFLKGILKGFVIRICFNVKSQRTNKIEVFSQGTHDSTNLRCETLYIGDYKYAKVLKFAMLDITL